MRRASQGPVVGVALAGLIALSIAGGSTSGWRMALLALIGGAAGVSLYHAAFGFASAWRRFLVERRGVGLRAQLAMLAIAVIGFFPLLAHGTLFGQPLYGFVMPVGPALVLGAFLFGIGMQLGGGCGSGTLYTAGGGSVRMLVTLAAFIAGSLVATVDPLGWTRWPAIEGRSLVDALGAPLAVATALALLAVLHAVVLRLEKARHGSAQPLPLAMPSDWLHGPWPLLTGAIALALVNLATLIVAGRPWGITSAFALWGAKLAAALGLDVAHWQYWQGDASLPASLLADATTVMDLGLMLGALAAAGAAGRFAPVAQVPPRSLLAALLGGLLMGLGARLATGCNIGAFFSGIASGSLHGVVWMLAALPGNWLGVRLRPRFGLD